MSAASSPPFRSLRVLAPLAVLMAPTVAAQQAAELQQQVDELRALVLAQNAHIQALETGLQQAQQVDVDMAGAQDTAWMILCGTLVMFMHVGFAMLETGSCRAKNASNVLLKNILCVSVGTVGWWCTGWGLAFGGPWDANGELEGGFAGTSGFLGSEFLQPADAAGQIAPNMIGGKSKMANWFFQWAFAMAAGSIVSGAVAERVQGRTFALFTFVMSAVIYPVVVAWTWGGGWLSTFADVGFTDFAGSGVVHLTGGVSALAGAVILGPRLGRWEMPEEFEAHNLPLVVLGTLSLWFGWYGFNCGSTGALHDATSGALAAQVAMNTTLSAATGGLGMFLLRWLLTKRYDVGGLCTGTLAGLVSITAGCANVESGSAVAIGLLGGFLCQGCIMLQRRLGIDDPVEASSIHGACGVWGVLAAMLFDWGSGWSVYNGSGNFGCITEDDGVTCRDVAAGSALLAQVVLILSVVAWSGVLSVGTFMLLMMSGKLREHMDVEEDGLDVSHHNPASAYSLPQAPPCHSPAKEYVGRANAAVVNPMSI